MVPFSWKKCSLKFVMKKSLLPQKWYLFIDIHELIHLCVQSLLFSLSFKRRKTCLMNTKIMMLYLAHYHAGVVGDLLAEEDVLQWLILQKTEDTIETVNRNMLEVMLEDTQYLAVFFCKWPSLIHTHTHTHQPFFLFFWYIRYFLSVKHFCHNYVFPLHIIFLSLPVSVFFPIFVILPHLSVCTIVPL